MFFFHFFSSLHFSLSLSLIAASIFLYFRVFIICFAVAQIPIRRIVLFFLSSVPTFKSVQKLLLSSAALFFSALEAKIFLFHIDG